MFKDSRSASAHYIEQMLKQISDPCITVETSQPKLVDHIYMKSKLAVNPTDMQRSVTVLKIKDPLSNRPLCKISNPQLPIQGFSKGYDSCINLTDYTGAKSVKKSPDFGFDSLEINTLPQEHNLLTTLTDLSTKPDQVPETL